MRLFGSCALILEALRWRGSRAAAPGSDRILYGKRALHSKWCNDAPRSKHRNGSLSKRRRNTRRSAAGCRLANVWFEASGQKPAREVVRVERSNDNSSCRISDRASQALRLTYPLGQACPLWVKSRREACQPGCLLSAISRTRAAQNGPPKSEFALSLTALA